MQPNTLRKRMKDEADFTLKASITFNDKIN